MDRGMILLDYANASANASANARDSLSGHNDYSS